MSEHEHIKHEADGSITISYNFTPSADHNLLEREEAIRDAVHELGNAAMAHELSQHDADGRPIEVEGQRYTAKKNRQKKISKPSSGKSK